MLKSRRVICLFAISILAVFCSFPMLSAQELEVLGSCYFPDYEIARSIYVDGNYAYLARERGGLYIIDISEPSSPFVATIYDPSGAIFNDVVIRDNLAYLAVSGIGIMIMNVSNPTNPSVVGQTQIDSPHSHGIFVSKDFVYLAHCYHGIYIFGITNPQNPNLVGICYTTYYIAHDVIVSGQYAYAVDFNNGLTVADVSDPANPFATGSYYMQGCNSHLAILPDITYLIRFGGHLVIIDTSDPFNLSYISELSLDPIGSQDIKIVNNKAYIAGGGLAILDLTVPRNPVLLEQFDVNLDFNTLYVRGDLIYTAGSHSFCIIRYNGTTDVETIAELPEQALIISNCPNPFNSSTSINYTLTEPGMVNLSIYNIQGQRIEELSKGILEAGEHSITWDASDYPSGVYFARLEAGGMSKTAKMVLLK